MKWVFLLFLIVFTPALGAFLRAQPRYIPHACFAMGAIFYFLDPWLYIAPVSWAYWPGPVKGVEVSLIDGIAVAIIMATRGGARTPIGLKLGIGLYFAGIIVSTAASIGQTTWPQVFYAVQVLRAVIVFIAVKRATAMYPSVPVAILGGLSVGIFYNGLVAARQFMGGQIQAGGAMGHQNTLGMTTHFATMTAFALLLAGRRNLLAAGIVGTGALIAVVGGSRATIGLFAIGLVVVTVLSIRHQMTGRKGAFAALAGIAIVLAIPAMMWAVDRRPASARESSNRERQSFEEAARMIISDHPMGIGGNRYVSVANVGGYSERAGVAWNWANRSAPVHNAYYLVTAELGFLGLLGMLAILLSAMIEGLRASRRLIGERADLAIGLTATVIVVAAHHYFEWIFMTFYIHYLTGMSLGALIGLTRGVEVTAGRSPLPTASIPAADPGARSTHPVPSHSPVY